MKRTIYFICAFIGILGFIRCKDSNAFPQGFSMDGCQTDITIHNQSNSQYSVGLFVETSGSMYGFMPSNASTSTKFQDDMWDLISRLSQKFAKGFTIHQVKSKNENLVLFDKEAFRDYMNSGMFQLQTSTDIPEMIDSVISLTGPKKVSILISDLIFSPEDNSRARINQIDSDISYRFLDGKYASTIFHFQSDYKSKSVSASNSPYYVWVIGPEEGVRDVSETIRQGFKGLNEMVYGIRYPTTNYSILPGLSGVSHAIPLKCPETDMYYTWSDLDTDENNMIEFAIAVNFSHLPFYVQSNAFLQENLKIEGGMAEVVSVGSLGTLTDNTDKQLVKSIKPTHVIKIRAKNMLNSQVITIQLNDAQPKWFTVWDSPTDDMERKRTFGLSKMINGLNNAYGDRGFLLYQPMKILVALK